MPFNPATKRYEPANLQDPQLLGHVAASKQAGPRGPYFENDVTDWPNPHVGPHEMPGSPEPPRYSDAQLNAHPASTMPPGAKALTTGTHCRAAAPLCTTAAMVEGRSDGRDLLL